MTANQDQLTPLKMETVCFYSLSLGALSSATRIPHCYLRAPRFRIWKEIIPQSSRSQEDCRQIDPQKRRQDRPGVYIDFI
jgi:hypothetical protein